MKHLLLWLLLITSYAHAQTSKPDTSFVTNSIRNAKGLYTVTTRIQSQLYNGSQYIDYDPVEDEHPYFLTNDWTTGPIIYAGELYENTPLLYDIYQDKIIAEHYAGAFIELITARVTLFKIEDHTFKRFTEADDSRGSIPEGFYEVLYDGNVKVLAKYVKTYSETIRISEIEKEFTTKTNYYIVKNKAFYSVNSKQSVLQVLGDKKQDLKRYIRENKLQSGNRAQYFTRLVQFYDTLNP